MAINIVSLNARGLRDSSNWTRLLTELSNLCVKVVAVQETQFICEADCRVLEGNFVVSSAFGSRYGARVTQLVGRSLDAIINLVFADDGGRLVGADVAVKTFEFRIAAVHCPVLLWRDKGFVVRNRVKRISNEAVKCSAFMREVHRMR